MKVLVIGSGGREHALCWKLRQSKRIKTLFCAPGNPGTARVAENVSIAVDKLEELAAFAEKQKIDLTIVGPEYPLSLGVVDLFQSRGLKIFGPSKAASCLESSKSFAKEIMTAAGVPTAAYETFTERASADAWLRAHPGPVVLKADGLASGKGVFVCRDLSQALEASASLFADMKATKVVVEEFLIGKEASFIVAANVRAVVPLAPAHDYKRIRDNDEGPNTGGMGSVCPTNHVSSEQCAWALEHVMRPVLKEMERRGTPFSGFLYGGLMIDPQGKISVLEFNARLGDPETQSILRLLDSDLVEMLEGLMAGQTPQPRWKAESSICLVLAASGYPQEVKTGDEISGLEFAESLPGVAIFHAATGLAERSRLITAGGRVLGVTAVGSDLSEARARAYRAADMIQFRGRQLRRDIGA